MMVAQVSQKDEILAYLYQTDPATSKRRSISQLEALGIFRCYRLAARIKDLRKDGHKIRTEMKRDTNKKSYARYHLVK